MPQVQGRPGDQQVRNLVKKLALEDVVAQVQAGGTAISQAQHVLRRSERAAALGLDEGALQTQTAHRDFALARRHVRAARRHLKGLEESAHWRDLGPRLDAAGSDDEGKAALAEARSRWVHELLQADLPPGDAAEAAKGWDDLAEAYSAGGVRGLTRHLHHGLDSLESALSDEENWGRNPASPLEAWQWWFIVIVVGIAILVVIACIIFSGCSWIAAVILYFWGFIIVF
jgi:hypothetical protein